MPLLDKLRKKITNADVVSFDIFDTLLLRSFLEPQDLFYQLESQENRTGFAECRAHAEQAAWEKLVNQDKDDVTLDEIYSCMPRKYMDMKSQELQMEYNNLFANPEIKDIFDFAIQHNKQIIITSDMYLSHDFLRQVIIDKLGTDKFTLFVSCEFGKRKHTGNLFKYITRKLNIAPNKILHIGDNAVSDYKVPRGMGIKTYLYTKPSDVFLADKKVKSFLGKHDTLMGRNFLGILSLAHTYFLHNSKPSYWQNVGFLYGGVLAYTYVQQILKWVTKYKLSNVVFVARDGYTLKKVFDILNKNNLATAHYVYAPRFTNTLAYLDMGSDMVQNERKTVLLRFLSENGTDVLLNDDLDKYAKQLKQLSDIEREEYKKYILDFNFGKNIGIVDSVSASYSAQKLISRATENTSTIGFYWWTIPEEAKKQQVPNEQFYTGSDVPCFCHLIEFFFAASEKPIHRILNSKPQYKERIDKYEQIKIDLYPIISDAMVQFVDILTELKLTLQVSNQLVFDWMNSFVICADKKDFSFFKNIKNGVDQSHTEYARVLPKCTNQSSYMSKVFREIRHMFFRKKKTEKFIKIYILGIRVANVYRRRKNVSNYSCKRF